ncbi:hypothetical protein [Scytonema sp. NUACC26]|uniref:hypothetical protein n=1 Tax=Scytonema sp. NUACC26 TaxID=3140176 RepID=UPI0038B2F89C
MLLLAQEVGTFTEGNSVAPLEVTFNANATLAAVHGLINNITFANVSDNPTTTPRTVSFVLTDGDGGTSATVTKTVYVTAVNDAPAIAPNQTFSVNKNAPNIYKLLDETLQVWHVSCWQVSNGSSFLSFCQKGSCVQSYSPFFLGHSQFSFKTER